MIRAAFLDLMDTLVEMPTKPKALVYSTLGFQTVDDFDECAEAVTIEHPGLDAAKFFSMLYLWRGLKVDRDAIEIASRQWRKAIRDAVPIQGAFEALQQLRASNIRLGLLSNSYPPTHLLLQRFRLSGCFDALTLSCDVGAWKPSQAIFREALVALDARADEACMIGNKISTDIVGALEAGIVPILFQHAGQTRPFVNVQGRNVRVIAQLSELPTAISTCSTGAPL